jgi:hypothetical protein
LNRKILIAAIAGGFLIFVGVLTFLMVGNRKHRVEVCMTYQGNHACSTAAGATEQEAVRTATEAACALIASGVGDTMACGQKPPDSVRKLD